MKTSLDHLRELQELHQAAEAKARETDPSVGPDRLARDRLAIELGMTQSVATDAIVTLMTTERRLAIANKRLTTWIDPTDLPDILNDYASECSVDQRHRADARMWLQKQGYLSDPEPLPRDTEATVGPIRDHGNPFETGIPV